MKNKGRQAWMMTLFQLFMTVSIPQFLSCVLSTDPEIEQTPIQIKEIAIMPFLKGKFGATPVDSLTADISRLSSSPDKITEDGHNIVTELVRTVMVKRYEENVIPLSKTEEALTKMNTGGENTIQRLAQKVGKAIHAPYVITGNVWRFKDRIGSAWGVEEPASVAFNVFLIDVKTGMLLWKATFDKTQQSLAGNLLEAPEFFKAGGKWLTAKELARLGVQKVFSRYPY